MRTQSGLYIVTKDLIREKKWTLILAQRDFLFLYSFYPSFQICEGKCRVYSWSGPREVRPLKSRSYYVRTHLCPQLTIREASDKAGPLCQMKWAWGVRKIKPKFWKCWLHTKIILFFPVQFLKIKVLSFSISKNPYFQKKRG